MLCLYTVYNCVTWSTTFVISSVTIAYRGSSKSSIQAAGLIGTAERPFLTPKLSIDSSNNTPSLDEFDSEIEIYQVNHPCTLLLK